MPRTTRLKPENLQEPTMEEVLASIREIIAQDEIIPPLGPEPCFKRKYRALRHRSRR